MKKTFLALSGAILLGCLLFQSQTSQLAPKGKAQNASARELLNQSNQTTPPPSAAKTEPTPYAASRVPNMAPLHAYRDWEAQYMAASKEERAGMVAAGSALAKARRPEFQKLIKTNPQLALEIAVRPVIRQDLPAEVLEQLEKPVSARGDFKAYFGRPAAGVELPPDQELVMRYFETPEGASYKANVYGDMLEATSRKDVALRGVAVERDLAVHESPVRQLESGERIAAGTQVDETCPVSNITTETKTEEPLVIEEETPVVELGGRLIRLCNGTHVRVFDEAQRMASGGPGVAGYFKDDYPGTSSEAIGNFRCLYIRVTYPDQMRAPNTEASAHSDMRNVSRYYLESSFGRLTTTSTVTPLITMPHTKAWYIAKDSEVDGLGLVHSDARAEARKLGYDSGQYNCTIVRVNEGPRLSGISWGGGDSVWVSWDGMDVLNHECGHSLGRNHANFWNTSDGSAIGLGSNQEYGNSFDVMGGGGGFGAHYNSYSKRSLGWLPDTNIHRPGTTQASNGIYRLYAYDQPQLEEGKRYSLRVDKDPQRRFYLEYHPAIGGSWPDQVLMLMSGLGSNAGHLVDTTPGSKGGKGDGGIQIGRTFSDFESDMHFTVIGKNATVPPSMDLAMMRGPFPGNQPPEATLSASAATVAVNGSLTFTATASDPNGDPLAYYWNFSDGYTAPNAAVITRSFSTTDQQTVELTVSDMKGGSVRRNTVITIGNPGRAVARGTITLGGQPVQGVLVTSDTDKYCFTDADGNYALADLQTGSRTLAAELTGYTFTAGFTNPVTLTATGATGLNWAADSVPEITLTSVDGAEGGANGRFILTRTGDTTDALSIKVAPATGSAVKTTDYSLSPDYIASGSMATLTIPAGAPSLTVEVIPVNDTAQEGPETVQLQLAAGDYQVRQSGVASLTIADNDTTRPVVSIAATGVYASENPGENGQMILRRTGSTGAALSVTLAFSGTATRGTDYPALPTTFTIPAGQSSTAISIVPADDSAIEVPEDVTITVSTNAAYIVDPAAGASSVTITDNDLATVSLNVVDDTLNEAGRGTGTVILTRTGNLSSPLKVYYGLSGRALHGTDYVALPGEVTFAAGMASVPVILSPLDDGHGEGDESFTISLTVFDNAYTLGQNYTGSLTIKDNADPPLVTVTANSAGEPASNGTFTFTAFGSVPGNITLRYTLSGTATSGSDFTAPSGTVTIAGTSTESKGVSATVSIPVLDDALPENTETLILTLTPDPAYVIANDGLAVMRLKDDDSEPVAVSTHSSGLNEPADGSSFYVSRAGTTGSLTVNYQITGTATNGTDYTLLPGTIVIPDGSAGVDIPVEPIDDTTAEGVETITLTLTSGAGYGIEIASGTLYLGDNDSSAMPSVGFFSATGSTSEAPDPVTGEYRDIQVTLSAAQPSTVTAEYMIGGGSAVGDEVDWTYVNAANGNAPIQRGLVTFAPGVLSQNVRIRVRNDNLLEGSETAILELRNVNGARISGSRNKHTLTITDNTASLPVPRVSFLVSATTRAESDGTEPLLIAALDIAATSPVTVNYSVGGTATAGVDYTLAGGTLTFAPGELFKKVPLVILADATAEPAETIVVTLTSPTGATPGAILSHTVTLSDNDAPIIALAASTSEAVEDTSTGLFTISRVGGASSLPVMVSYTVSGTAGNGTDFAPLSGSVLLPANQPSVSLPVVPILDTVQEADKTVILTLTADPNYSLSTATEATVTIVDDDLPPVVTLVSPAGGSVAIPSGVGLIAEVTATRELPSGILQIPVQWTQVSGPGTVSFESPAKRSTAMTFSAAGTYTISCSAAHGAAVSEVSISTTVVTPPLTQNLAATRFGNAPAAAGFTYNATSGVYTITAGGTSVPSSGTADQFLFASQPVSGDGTVIARVVSISTGGSATSDNRTGVMIRESLTDGGSRHAFMGITKSPATRFITRATPAAASTSNDGSSGFPCWVRLVRSGNTFTGSTAPDVSGTPGVWTQIGTRTVTMAGNVHFGIASASGSSSGNTTAAVVVDNVKLLNYPAGANLGPFVDAGAPLTGSGPWNLDATVTDDGLPLPSTLSTQWLTVSGPEVAGFGNTSSSDTPVTFPAPGAYRLRLTAGDGQVTTFDDTIANVTRNAPIEIWRAANFGAEAGNAALAGDLADYDKDGLSNLVEYALNSDPKAAVPSHLPTPATDGETLSLTYRVNLAATDISVQLQSSTNLGSWSNTAATLQTLSDDGQTRVIRATVPATGTLQFLRVLVTLGGAPVP